jgi:hypothetical protein
VCECVCVSVCVCVYVFMCTKLLYGVQFVCMRMYVHTYV